MTTRRALVRALGAVALLAGVGHARGQPQAKIPRVGMLYLSSAEDPYIKRSTAVFRRRLAERGYVEGKAVLIEERYAEGNAQRLIELARELAAIKVDVIVAPTSAATAAARQATTSIPIVMVHAGNPDPPQLTYDVVRNSNAIISLATQLMSILTGDPVSIEPVRRCHIEFADCLPILGNG